MIQEKSGFWDSIDPTPGNSGDERTYNAGEMTIPFEYLVTNGVQTGGAFLQVTPGSYDYSSRVAPGTAWIKGRWYILRDDGTGGMAQRILLHDAPIQYNRIDRVVLRYDANYTLSGRKIVAAVLKGVEAASPAAPSLTRNDEIYELSLARVLIKPGQPIVVTGDITDERFGSDLCGIAEFAPQPDLQPYIEQFQQRLNDMFGDIEALDAAAITSGVLSAARLPLSSAVDSASEAQAATSKAVKSVNDKTVAIEAANAPITTGGTATAYTLTPAPAISAYADNQIWTVRFHVDSGANPTLNVSGKGAAAILEATGRAAKIKAGQIVRVMRYGASFFTVSGGGGTELITEIITASQTWTKPTGILDNRIFVRVLGGGGGGGCSAGYSGGGGGGGHMDYMYLNSANMTTVTITIGAGGAGGVQAAQTGATGGVTSFGTYISASGGAGGASGDASTGGVGGSSGGAGHGGSMQYGANATYGGGGGGAGSSTTGGNGGKYGGGGGGSYGGAAGAYGGPRGANGWGTAAFALDFTGTGLCPAIGNVYCGGGGYGGAGGAGTDGATGGGGGGGYAGTGGAGGSGWAGGGGGGGGYGGAGGAGGAGSGSGWRGGGGGGGGYGATGTGGTGGSGSTAPTAGGVAAGGGGGGYSGQYNSGAAGGSGICIIQYYK